MESHVLISIYAGFLLLSVVLGMIISKFVFQKPVFSLVTLVACVILFSLSRRLIVPEIKEMIFPNIVETMQTQPLFQALKNNEPEEYQNIVKIIENNNIKLEKQALAVAQSRAQSIIRNRVGKARDATVSQFFTAMEGQLRELAVHNDLCLRQFSLDISPEEAQLISQTAEKTGVEFAMIELLNDPLPQSKPHESSVLPEIHATFRSLAERYGKDRIGLVENPQKARTTEEKQLVCQMLADMYATLNHPNDKKKMATLRFLFSIPK